MLTGVALTWWRQSLYSFKGLFMWLNWPGYISNILVRPILLVAMFSLTGRFARGEAAAEAFAIGMIAYGVPNLLTGGIMQGFYYERSFATLSTLFASTANRFQTYISRGVLHWPGVVVSVIASIAGARLIVGLEFSEADWTAVSVAFLLICTTTALFALALGNFCIPVRDWQSPYGVTQIAFLALTGAIIPRSDLPVGLYELGALLPITHGLAAAREAFAGAGLAAIREELLWEAVVGLAYGVLGYAMFRFSEGYARRSGSYEYP
jgi:ABC-2 type transport system permease protein